MKTVNWLNIQLTPNELESLNKEILEPEPISNTVKRVVGLIIKGYPWDDRQDSIDSYHPNQMYQIGQWISIPIHNSEGNHLTFFQVAKVITVESAGNPIQGKFQVLTLDAKGVKIQLACNISKADFPKIDFLSHSEQEFDLLTENIANSYSTSIQIMLEKLTKEGVLLGEFHEGTFIPKCSENAISRPITAYLEEKTKPIKKKSLIQKIWLYITIFFIRLFRRASQ